MSLVNRVAEVKTDPASSEQNSKVKEIEIAFEYTENGIFPKGDLISDEPPLETELHLEQIILLLKCLKWLWRDRNDFYAAANLTIYYSQNKRKNKDFRGPDFFVVLDTEQKLRKSWVVWEEDGKFPNVIVEILSESTAATDREAKKILYQNTFATPEYFWFDPYTLEFAGFYLVDSQYTALEPNEKGHLWSRELGLYLGIHQGLIRYFTAEGELVPTPEEQAERLAAKLRELNIDPDSI